MSRIFHDFAGPLEFLDRAARKREPRQRPAWFGFERNASGIKPRGMRRRKLASETSGSQSGAADNGNLILRESCSTARNRLAGGPRTTGGLRRARVWVMRAVIFGYFGTLTDPVLRSIASPSRTAPASCSAAAGHGSGRRWPGAPASAPIGVHGGTESTLRAVALSCGANPSSAQLPVALAHHRSGHARLRKPRHHGLGVLVEFRRRGSESAC